jgi:hypothetical protein
MPALVAMFGVGIKLLMAYAVTRLFLALGLAYVTYQGLDTLLSNIQSQIQSDYGSLSASVFAIISMCGADKAISIIFSAIAIRMVYNGVVGGAKTALRFKVA